MADSFNLNRIFRMFSLSGEETLQLGVYNQVSSLVMFRKNTQDNRPVVRMSIDAAARMNIVNLLKDILDSTPDTRRSFIQMQYNRDQKSYEPHTTFTFGKDEKNLLFVEVGNKILTPPVKFVFKCSNSFTLGADPLSDMEKSKLHVLSFIETLEKKIPTAELLSTWNMTNQPRNGGGRGNNGGGGGYNRGGGNNGGGGGGGYRRSDEDALF